jgi:hypothetical protein
MFRSVEFVEGEGAKSSGMRRKADACGVNTSVNVKTRECGIVTICYHRK